MKAEQTERLLIDELFNKSITQGKIKKSKIESIEKLTGDASTRRYYRLKAQDDKYVVCLDNPVESDSENKFVVFQKYLESKGIRVPRVYDVDPSKGYILEEDLGDVTFLKELANCKGIEEVESYYKRAIDEMIKIHSINIEQDKWINLYFDFEKLMDEISFTFKYFITHFLGVESNAEVSSLQQEFVPICKRLSREKMCLTHRDFHSRNIMIKNSDLIIIDFQDARHGIPQYDLCSLLEDCYYDLPRGERRSLIEYYYKNSRTEMSFDNFLSLYNDMAIQRVFKAIGSFSYINYHREDIRYVKYIGFAMEKLKLIMLRDNRYTNLYNKLFSLYYES